MRLLLLFVISVFLSSKGFSQFNVYLKPVVGTKFNSSVPGVSHSGVLGVNSLSNTYVDHQQLRFLSMRGFDIGLDAGIQLKKHFIEFQYYYTSIVNGYVGSYYSYSNNNGEMNYGNLLMKEKYGIVAHKFALGYNYEIFRSKNNLLGLRTSANLGFYFNNNFQKNMWALNNKMETPANIQLDENVFLSQYTTNHTYHHRFNGFGTLGLGFDFYTKKNRNLFSLDVSYTQGFRRLTSFATTYRIDDGVDTKNYSYVTTGRGSTLNIQISRRFQLYPWIKSKRKELQEQGVYKSKD